MSIQVEYLPGADYTSRSYTILEQYCRFLLIKKSSFNIAWTLIRKAESGLQLQF